MAEYLNYECSGMAGSPEGVDRRLWLHLETITLRLRFNSESHWDESEQGELKSLSAGADLDCDIGKVVFVE